MFIDAPREVIERRAPSDLYGRARRGEIVNVVGVDLPFSPPTAPDLVVQNGADAGDPGAIAGRILGQGTRRVSASILHPPAIFRFGTKGETLERLAPLIRRAKLCEQIILPVAVWHVARGVAVDDVLARFAGRPLAVRSSSIMEDGWRVSNAGRFTSVTGVAPESAALAAAIERVIGSYGREADGQQVLIQPMVQDVALAGVVLTRDLDTGSPYYVIDYDDFTGRTDTVTGGVVSKMALVHRSNPGALHSPRMRAVIDAVQEIEAATGSQTLDIEFCMAPDLSVTVLQVRPLAAGHRWQDVPDAKIDAAIAEVRGRVQALQAPCDGIAGATTILGEMPDWNPAEMIGTTPRRLAMSLYRRLITDRVWSQARARMGYRDVALPLMIDLAGRPYIDVRLSLNSFLTGWARQPRLCARIVDAELARLAARPEHHDKIEFEVAITCRDLAFGDALAPFAEAGLTAPDLEAWGEALGALTQRSIMVGRAGIEALAAEARSLLAPTITGDVATLADADGRLTATARSGTLPFSILARHAFIGVTFLRSLVRAELLAPEETEAFMRGVRTIATEVVESIAAVADGRLAATQFLARCGHLRPGTYDILSWRYDERPDLYLGHCDPHGTRDPAVPPSTAAACRDRPGDRERRDIGSAQRSCSTTSRPPSPRARRPSSPLAAASAICSPSSAAGVRPPG